MYQPVKDHQNWFRDSKSGSFNCADESTYQKYMKAYQAEKKAKEDFTTLQNDPFFLRKLEKYVSINKVPNELTCNATSIYPFVENTFYTFYI